MDPFLHIDAVGADAGLPGVAVFRRHRRLHRLIEIGVIEDNEGRIAAKLHVGFLDRARALLHQQLSNPGRAGERQLGYNGIGRHFLADFRRVACHNAKDPGGNARPLRQHSHCES